jgi:hypothetical protein
MPNATTVLPALETLPQSSVPAALDRGHLYSPTLDLARYALDDTCAYDYRPGDLYEPMPPAPHGGTEFAWWWLNTARITTPDFLGLHAGDQIAIQHATNVGPGKVITTYRFGAVVQYPLPVSSLATRTHEEMYVRRRNDAGHWY